MDLIQQKEYVLNVLLENIQLEEQIHVKIVKLVIIQQLDQEVVHPVQMENIKI